LTCLSFWRRPRPSFLRFKRVSSSSSPRSLSPLSQRSLCKAVFLFLLRTKCPPPPLAFKFLLSKPFLAIKIYARVLTLSLLIFGSLSARLFLLPPYPLHGHRLPLHLAPALRQPGFSGPSHFPLHLDPLPLSVYFIRMF